MHPNFDVIREIEAELAHDAAWVNHCPLSVVETFVPVRRSPQDRSRIAGTERADHHMANLLSIFKHDKLIDRRRIDTHFGAR